MTDTNRAQEAASWREMHEMLHEAYGVHELEGEYSATNQPNGNGRRRTANISTPMVIIRITLAPSRLPIFSNRRAIADALPTTPTGTTATAMPYVPVQAPTVAADGPPSPARGVVFLPQKGSDQVHIATQSPTYAGAWVRRQAQVAPAFGQRIRRVQVLVDGQPCKSCVSNLVRNVRPAMPAGTRLNIRYTQPSPSVAIRPNLGVPQNVTGVRPTIRYPQPPAASQVSSTGIRSGLRPTTVATPGTRPAMRYPQRPATGNAAASTRPAIRYPQPPAAGRASSTGIRPSLRTPPTTAGTAIRYPQPPAATRPPQPRPAAFTSAGAVPNNGLPRQPNGRFAPRQAAANPASPRLATPPRPATAPTSRPVAAPRSGQPQRESQSFLGALFGESGL